MCANTEFLIWEFGILLGGYLTGHYIGILVLHQNSVYDVVYLPTCMDFPSVIRIDKIQDQSVCTPHLTVCLYSH
jgi:hypothetical protein